MRNPERLGYVPEEYRGREKEIPDLSEIEITEDETKKLMGGVLNLEEKLENAEKKAQKFEGPEDRQTFLSAARSSVEIPPHDAAQLLKAVSSKATGTRETAFYEIHPADPEAAKEHIIQEEKDAAIHNTYYGMKGVIQWVDNEGVRWVAPRSKAVELLLERIGLEEKPQRVAHADDSELWMMHHNPFRLELYRRAIKHRLQDKTIDDVKRNYLKEELKTSKWRFNPKEYNTEMVLSGRKREVRKKKIKPLPKRGQWRRPRRSPISLH